MGTSMTHQTPEEFGAAFDSLFRRSATPYVTELADRAAEITQMTWRMTQST
jgi:hypothetical protein